MEAFGAAGATDVPPSLISALKAAAKTFAKQRFAF